MPRDRHCANGNVEKNAVGVARCKYCNCRLPLDMDKIEEHSEECRRLREAEDAAKVCRCHRCGQQIPSNMDAIENHTLVCTGTARGVRMPRDRRCWRTQ